MVVEATHLKERRKSSNRIMKPQGRGDHQNQKKYVSCPHRDHVFVVRVGIMENPPLNVDLTTQ